MKERLTKQKQVIVKVLEKKGRHMTAEEVLLRAKKIFPHIGIATIYRNLESMVQKDYLDVVYIVGQPKWFETKKQGYHGHMYCEKCKNLFDVTSCSLCLAKNQIVDEADFEAREFQVLILGKCGKCK